MKSKVLLKKINMNWKIRELIEYMTIMKTVEPNCFIDGSQCAIMVIK